MPRIRNTGGYGSEVKHYVHPLHCLFSDRLQFSDYGMVLRDKGIAVCHPAGGSRGTTPPPNAFLCSSCTRPFQSRQPGGPSLHPPSAAAIEVSPPFQQCCGSMKFWYGSGCGSWSADPYLWLTDPEPEPAIFVSDLQDVNKKNVLNVFAY